MEEKIKIKCKKIAKSASKWQLKKFDFWHALPIVSWCITFFVLIIIMLLSLCLKTEVITKCINVIIILIAILPLSFIIEICCKPKLRYSNGIHLFLPRLLGTIIAGWLMVAFASNIFPHFHAIVFKSENGLWWKNLEIVVILLLLTGAYVYGGISQALPYLTRCKKLKLTSLLICIAFCYSYLIGIFTTILIGSPTVSEELNIPEKCAKYNGTLIELDYGIDTYISPGFLFVFTFVAMFIGLFINMIFEEKQITDSE